MLNQALLNPSGFLAANIASYMDAPYMETPFQNVPPMEEPHQQRFSEFLAALERPAGGENDVPVRDEPVGEEIVAEDEAEDRAAEVASARNVPVAAQTAVKLDEEAALSGKADEAEYGVEASVEAPTEDGTAAELVEAAGAAQRSEAFAEQEVPPSKTVPEARPDDGRNKSRLQTASAEAGGATDKVKMPPASEEAGKTEAAPLDIGNGVYVDENTLQVEEQLAGFDGENPVEKTARSSSGTVADDPAMNGGAEDAVTPAMLLNAAENMTTAPPVKEKEGRASAVTEKKSPAERARRNAADERRGVSAAGVNVSAQSGETAPVRPVSVGGVAEAEITVNLRGEHRGAAPDGRGTSDGAKPAASFENFLVRELQQNLNGSIVKQAQLMLREGGEGTIRLSLKPESLGKVKIHLEMAENKITGKIVVESGEALRAFEHEMRSLEQTFQGEGFDGASLSLELDGRDGQQNGEGWRHGGENSATRTASSRYGETAQVEFFGASYSAKQVNVLV